MRRTYVDAAIRVQVHGFDVVVDVLRGLHCVSETAPSPKLSSLTLEKRKTSVVLAASTAVPETMEEALVGATEMLVAAGVGAAMAELAIMPMARPARIFMLVNCILRAG